MSEKTSPLRYYLLNTSFHGFRYISEAGRHWTERVFWALCCLLSWTATLLLIKSSWEDFQTNAISFVVDTSYLPWDTHFPSISVCESDNQKRIAEITDRIYGDPHDYNLDEIVKELVYFRGLSFYTLQICGPEAQVPSEDCAKGDLGHFSQLVRSNCSQIFRKCRWNEEEFDCCAHFGALDTEMGVCYAINSIQEDKTKRLKMVSNIKTGPGKLYLEINGFANVYILGEQEVPSMTTLTTDVIQVTPHIHYRRFLAVKEIDNQPEVKDVSIRQRKCRFSDESDLNVYRYYSYSACCVQCRKDAQLKICNCAHHLMPNTPPKNKCNITGLYCLSKHYNELSVLKPYWANRTGLVCDCLPSCTEMELAVVRDDKIGIPEDYAIVELALERLPTERYKRNVVRGKLDLVVSMGGSTALFLGASILSFVEVLYYFFVRPVSDSLITKQKMKENQKFRRFKDQSRLPTIS
ncbi:sodium channel protein Nach [Tribolium castaneum]|uniref:Sodium channel protein Nach-like Protein n=1 Tax=Tribolium castaneum TaxID=7070 RepID=D6WYQ4_TRICA|nr:PREDICTED: sodium channel protein Nach isoform X1 [Tribolium castaneum]EFA08448.1 Sodium channel protein Nach-like Protein [Tribolium castaneum]|eukprot:XP_967526.1 PREDICTED: sodium channel protein Nach isoform X1 [Tribolium castaneum]